jgi:hypothetical protein
MDKRRTAALVVAGLIVLSAARVPSADIRIETHDLADLSPQRFRAAVDVGVFAASVLVTWTAERVSR